MIDEFDDDVRTYLSAVGALAVYVAEQDSIPVRVGFCHDPVKVLTYMARKWPRTRFGWIAWFEDQQPAAASFVAEIQENAKELIFGRREDNVMTPRRLPWVVAHIENLAKMEGVTLTPHAIAVNRAKLCARRLADALNALQSRDISRRSTMPTAFTGNVSACVANQRCPIGPRKRIYGASSSGGWCIISTSIRQHCCRKFVSVFRGFVRINWLRKGRAQLAQFDT